MDITTLQPEEIDAVVALWTLCDLVRPWNDPHADIALALKSRSSTVLVGHVDDRLVASAMVGLDGHRGGVYYVSVHPHMRGQGLGRTLMAAVEAWLRQQGAPKLNLMVREDNARVIGFYKQLGFEQEERVILSKRFD
jgi:ribosomal protein S18 acetylase RimI-like enzyme